MKQRTATSQHTRNILAGTQIDWKTKRISCEHRTVGSTIIEPGTCSHMILEILLIPLAMLMDFKPYPSLSTGIRSSISNKEILVLYFFPHKNQSRALTKLLIPFLLCASASITIVVKAADLPLACICTLLHCYDLARTHTKLYIHYQVD